MRELLVKHPKLREPVIHGLLREGETMNVVAAPKTNKSWLVLGFAMSVATGRPWLNTFPTVKGDVLILDNELHVETIAYRIPTVAKAMNIPLEDIGTSIYVESLRGNLRDILALGPYFDTIEPGRFRVIVIDAFYRMMPLEMNENDNGTMASIYNCLDRYAARLGCAFILVHHASKGSQSGKAVTDVGAGAGAQSRASDTHLVLRPHKEEGVVVLDGAVRSWKPIEPVCLKWRFPLWLPEPDLDPEDLRGRTNRKNEQGPPKPPPVQFTPEQFTKRFITETPAIEETIVTDAEAAGLSAAKAKRLLAVAVEKRLVFKWLFESAKARYATVEQPITANQPSAVGGGGRGVYTPPHTPPVPQEAARGAGGARARREQRKGKKKKGVGSEGTPP